MISGFHVEYFNEVVIAAYSGNFSQCLVLWSRNCSLFIRRLKKSQLFYHAKIFSVTDMGCDFSKGRICMFSGHLPLWWHDNNYETSLQSSSLILLHTILFSWYVDLHSSSIIRLAAFEKLLVPQTIKKFLIIYGTLMCVTTFIRAFHWTPNLDTWTLFKPSYLICFKSN
jgi:hypothetical protein